MLWSLKHSLKHNEDGIISNGGSCEHKNVGLFCLADDEYVSVWGM